MLSARQGDQKGKRSRKGGMQLELDGQGRPHWEDAVRLEGIRKSPCGYLGEEYSGQKKQAQRSRGRNSLNMPEQEAGGHCGWRRVSRSEHGSEDTNVWDKEVGRPPAPGNYCKTLAFTLRGETSENVMSDLSINRVSLIAALKIDSKAQERQVRRMLR